MDSSEHDLMCDPATYQVVESPANTRMERNDTRELCYSPENTFHLPSEERRMNRSMSALPMMSTSIFRIRSVATRKLGSKR
mgnify:FL=1